MIGSNNRDAAVLVEAIRPERKRGFFGLGQAAVAVPPATHGSMLFFWTCPAQGESRFQRVPENEKSIPLGAGAEPMFFLRVRASSLHMEMVFPAAAKDRVGRSLDLSFAGQWRLENPSLFLQQGAKELVAPGNPLLNSSAQTWIAGRIQSRVHDEFAASARDYEFADFVSRQVLPLETWQTRLRAWLADFGVALELAEVRPACAEAAREQAARQQAESLKQSCDLNQRIRQALRAEAELEAEFQNERGRRQLDVAMADAAREQQLAELRIAYRERLFQAEEKLRQLVREADEATQQHLVRMAQLREQLADAELARTEREHQGELDRVLREQKQRLLLAQLEVDLQAIRQAQSAQAQAFEREARRQELLFQAEMKELREDLQHKANTKEAESTRLLQQAQEHCDRAGAVHATAAERALKRQEQTPKLGVLSARQPPAYFEILRPWFFCGRERPCHVVLPSPSVSAHHCSIARIAGGWLLVDHASRNGSSLNGEAIRQQYLVNGDLLRVDGFWLLFTLREEHEFRQLAETSLPALAPSGATIPRSAFPTGSNPCAPSAPRAGALLELAASSGQVATSDGGPILIGHGSACTLRLTGDNLGRFHAVVFWDAIHDQQGGAKEAGVYVEDLHSGRGLLLNGQAVRQARLNHRDVLDIAGHRITVAFNGNVPARAEQLCQHRPPFPVLAITTVEGPSVGKSLKLASRKDRFIVGRDPACDLVVEGLGISRLHVELCRVPGAPVDPPQPDGWTVADLTSATGTRLNGAPLPPGQPATLRPGDILRLAQDESRCDLLVHYSR